MRTEYPKKYWWLVLVVVPIFVSILPIIVKWMLDKNGTSDDNHEYPQKSVTTSAHGIGYLPKEVSNPGQRRPLAERAAQTVALRNLAEFETIIQN
jgi:hypothetical protein